MDTGISREQLDAIKGIVRRWTEDAVSLRCVMSLLILAVGYLALVRPLTIRLEDARAAHTRKSRRLGKMEDLAHWKSQTDRFVDRTAHTADVVDWQRYVLGVLGHTENVRLLNLEPRQTGGKGVYKFIEMEIVARSQSYSDFAAFIHDLERGERIVRVDNVRIELAQGNLTLTALVKGLCRPNLATPSAPTADGKADEGADALAKDDDGTPADEPLDAPADDMPLDEAGAAEGEP